MPREARIASLDWAAVCAPEKSSNDAIWSLTFAKHRTGALKRQTKANAGVAGYLFYRKPKIENSFLG